MSHQTPIATEVLPSVNWTGKSGRLVQLSTGRIIDVAGNELVIGRSEDCDIVLNAKGLSRRHALLRAEGNSYSLTDESTNGTFVNGERVAGTRTLFSGDVLTLGAEQYRFEVAGSDRPTGATAVLPSARAAAPPLAVLEIVRGLRAGTAHRIDRPVCSVGRGQHNDINLADESVSTSHASLMLKGETWYLTDMRSANGSYVNGYRIGGERALSAGCNIRLGKVDMTFRPRPGAPDLSNDTRVGKGIFRRLLRALVSPDD